MDNYLEPEFDKPFNTWLQDPSPINATPLLKAINPVLTSALRTYGTQASPTLHSRAKIMALDAMKRYDPSKAKLRTHLMFQLQGLRRHAAREQQILSVPEKVDLDQGHLRDSENFLSDKLGRDPSDMELSDHVKIPLKRITYIRKGRPSYAEGSMQRATPDSEDIFEPAVQGQNKSNQEWLEFVYHDMEPINQLIMEHSFGLQNKKIISNEALAKKLRMSPGAVSQRKAKIQAKLDLQDVLGFGN